MPIRFLNTTGVEDFFVADASADRVGIGTTSPKQLLHLMKGGITVSFTAPDSEVLRVQSKASSELAGNPPASDINIFTDGTNGGYSRVIFTDDVVTYGENGLYYDHGNRYFQIVNKGNTQATFTTNGGVFLGKGQNVSTADDAFAANRNNTASGNYSFAAGELTEASANQAAAFGYDTTASGGASFATGALTTASGSNSFTAGATSTASGTDSAALGFATTASGNQSLAIGYQTTASGNSSFAGGGPTTLASGENAFAFGADVDIIGAHSAGFGRLHDIDGNENLVGGVSNIVDGDANLVGGANNDLNTKDNNLVAGGSHTMTVDAGDYNTIIGFNNEIGFGNYNLSGGQETYNFGTRSISFGSGTTASKGDQQFAFGQGTTTPTNATSALSSNQFVVGKFNDFNYDCLFSVGNGTSTSSRSNALIVRQSGTVGIGTNLPNYKLHVAGGNDAGVWVERTTSGSEGSLSMLASNTANVIQSKGLGNATKQLNFIVGVGTVMSIATSGNVGIGNPSPSEKLEVNGSIKASAATDAYKGYIKNTITCTPLMKTANTSYNYLPYNSTIFSSTADYFNRMVAAYDGRVKKIILRHISGTTPTATGMKFKKEINGTVIATEYTATVTGGASTSFTAIYNFANSDFTFSEGDSIGILAQTSGGTGNIGGASAQIIVEYNIT